MRVADTCENGQRQERLSAKGYRGTAEKKQLAGWAEPKKQRVLEQEEAEKTRLDISEAVREILQKRAEENKKASDKADETSAELGKIMEIARRIARGDQVPQKDEKKLMEYSAELYKMAKSAAMLNLLKKRKKHKSLFDEDEKDTLEKKIRELAGTESGVQSAAAGKVTASGEEDSESGAEEV